MPAADAYAKVPAVDGRSHSHLEKISARPEFFRGFGKSVADIWQFRELLGNLVSKELKVRYKESVLGFLWTLVRPLMQLLVYSVAIGVFLGSSKAIPEFGVYLFTGLLAWGLFTDIVGGCTGSIVGNAGLVKKVYFPRELFPLSVVGAAVVNFFLQIIVLLGAYVVTGSWPRWQNLLLVPLALLVLVVFATAIGLLLAASNVFLRDVQHLVEIGLLLWFWLTPIVYDWTKVRSELAGTADAPKATSWLFDLYMSNPMANVVLAFQRALWPGGLTERGATFYYGGNLSIRLLICLAASTVLLFICQRVFARAQGNFAQEL